MEKEDAVNVLGEALEPCSVEPLTGFFRDGCCNTALGDAGSHTVCAELSEDFLEFTRSCGNDLSTPRPEFGFPGLKPGQRWCLCAGRWLEAHAQGRAPRVFLRATHKLAVKTVPMEILRDYALDLN